jgi:Zn-dependent protease with chaperone function
MESIHVESAPDVLKLNPLFVIFTSHQDYTSHLGRVLCLTYPGESVYLTPKDPDAWYGRLAGYVPGKNMEPMSERKTLPLWHPSVMKRLLGKLYYSVTVKGISAYSALVLLMYQLELPWWGILAGILAWWGVNLYFSDRVLKAALDGEPLAEGAVYEAAQRIFQRAGLEGVRLYATEANEYNGLAIGMNVGRSMIVLTSATLKLPLSAIEGILAHEAVHVKKRDVLSGQLLRLLGLGVIIGLIVINLDTVQYLVSEYTWLMIALFALMPWLYPIYLSMAHQWMEVRADHLGSTYLEGGKAQMAEALRQLTVHQEQAIDKYLEYSLTDEEREKRNKHRSSELERDRWGWRLLEFQLQFHPPMYWRINTLENVDQPWGWGLMKRWWVDRMMESLPDRWKGKNKACGGAGRDNAPS